jgi:hypothetical protein
MMRKYAIPICVVLLIGLVPYIASFFSYRGSGGSVANVYGIQYDYVLVDRSHYQSPKVLIYPKDHVSSVSSSKLDIKVDGKDVEFGADKVLLLKPDKSVVKLGWNKEWFVTSSNWGSEIWGIFGPVPHFKRYQIEYPDSEQFKILIEQFTHNKMDASNGK